jgi:murein DD-endopeptidase MepM/ murein hydrolase activator NlpD
MIRKAHTYQSSSEQNWGNFLVHHPLLLKVVTWLSSISLLASATISGAEIKPITFASSPANAINFRQAPTLPIVVPAAANKPQSKSEVDYRTLHSDVLTADNLMVAVLGNQSTPVHRYQSKAGKALAITVPAAVDCNQRTSQLVSRLCSQVRPQSKAIAPIRQSLIPTRLTPVVRPLPIVSSNQLLLPTNNVPVATLSPTTNSRLQIQLQRPQPLAPVIPGAVALYVAPSQSNVIPSKVVEPLSKIPQVKKPAIPNLAPIPTVQARSITATTRLSSYGLDSSFVYPLANPAPQTSRFGWRVHPISGNRRFHAGIDLGAPAGAPIVAAATGRVVVANWHGGYGKTVVIEHNGQLQTLYGHMSEIFVQEGQEIRQGTVIGLVGSTGNSTGPHLHFETHAATNDGWIAVDPNQEVQLALNNLLQSIQSYRQNTVTSNQL